jgi:FixJ family two-component response regulator
MIAATLFVETGDLQRIRASLAADGVEVIPAASLDEAIQTPAPVILLDGDSHPAWDQALRHVVEMRPMAKVVVLARNADHRMWVEVLSQGAHDLLCKPLLASEVRAAVLGALRIAIGTSSPGAAAA